eukprot:scaffold90263_cov69-Phaeocystis_antarctica.AAC.4
MSKATPVWPASVAQDADWPSLAEAPGSLERDLALREAPGEPAGRRLSHLVFGIGHHVPRHRNSKRVAHTSLVRGEAAQAAVAACTSSAANAAAIITHTASSPAADPRRGATESQQHRQ